ncbi:hypothetical protein SDC9_110934 [bioreactor metagenome]|uniref:Uncharacterized protein n=1 Tax=bioreactor metagenome TaxID=1076179 RepID=A0A645BG58_9ZZZZ
MRSAFASSSSFSSTVFNEYPKSLRAAAKASLWESIIMILCEYFSSQSIDQLSEEASTVVLL